MARRSSWAMPPSWQPPAAAGGRVAAGSGGPVGAAVDTGRVPRGGREAGAFCVAGTGVVCGGEPGVQLLADLIRRVGAAGALGPGDDHAAGGHAREAGQAEDSPPAHTPMLRL